MIFPSAEPSDVRLLQDTPLHVRRALLVGAIVTAVMLVPIPLTVTMSGDGASCSEAPMPDSEYDSLSALASRSERGDRCLGETAHTNQWVSLAQMVMHR